MKVFGGCYVFSMIPVIILVTFGSMATSVLGVCTAYWPDGSCVDETFEPYPVTESYPITGLYPVTGPYPTLVSGPLTTPSPSDSAGLKYGYAAITAPCFRGYQKDPTGQCRKLIS